MTSASGPAAGTIEKIAPSPDGQSTILNGWIGSPWTGTASGRVRLRIWGTPQPTIVTATATLFPRPDVAAIGSGILFLCDAPPAHFDGFSHIDIEPDGDHCWLRAAPNLHCEPVHPLGDLMRERLATARERVEQQGVLADPTFDHPAVQSGAGANVVIQHVINCGDAGILVLGHLAASEPVLHSLGLAAAGGEVVVQTTHIARGAVTVDQHGLLSSKFSCRLPAVARPFEAFQLVLTLADGRSARVASRAIEPGGRGSALVALAWIESFDALDDAFDQVFGPAITALERSYAACPVSVRRIDFGTQPIRPSVSLIIPLHKRIDYLEVQLGLFCGQPCLDGAEILFVVDDPPRQQEAKTLAASAFARFGLAFALLLPDRNLGFGRASNAGLDAAAGQSVCFLNSDVFPASPDWMARLIARLSQGDYGIVAPMLLFPDGSMQHRGMALQAMDRYAGWHFPRHTGKGMRPEGTGIMRVPAVTGACIVMTRRAARELGGFDEGFVIGDFEDSDLCLRAARAGLSCGVDLDVRMLHLERQSQGADAPWRMGATLYNAWRHERRWFPAGEAKALDVAAPARGRGRRG